MRSVLLGIDIGTSACKAAAFDLDGNVLAQASTEYAVYYPQPGWVEQEPDEWWQAVSSTIRSILDSGTFTAASVKGIGIDGQSWSAIPVDRQGQVLHRTPIWMDTRSREICREIADTLGEDRLFATSGNPLQPSYTLPKILWFKQNKPDIYNQAVTFLQSNSFIVYRLTGRLTQDMSQGYGLNCYNMRTGQWDYDLCRELGLRTSLLPEILPSHQVAGTVSAEAARWTGLLPGTPVVAGGLDAACGTLGAGVFEPGQTQEQGGQAGGMSICIGQYQADRRLILGNHVVPGLWLLQGGTVGGGGVIKWFEQEFGAAERELASRTGSHSLAELDKAAGQIAPGSDGLVMLPYMAGERSPIWNPQAKGVYFGIDYTKTRAHFARASMEGVAYSLRHNLDVAQSAGARAETLCAMGGAANSRLRTQIKADVTGHRIIVPSSDTATALGAAILAGIGTGCYSSFREAVARTVTIRREHLPDPSRRAVYEQGYRTYLALYEQLKDLMEVTA